MNPKANPTAVSKAKKLWLSGMGASEIGRQVGYGEATIRYWVKQWKLEPDELVHRPSKQCEGNTEKGTEKWTAISQIEPRTAEDIEILLNLDKTKWKLSNYWNKEKTDGTWHISALVTKLSVEENISQKFMDFLTTYKYRIPAIHRKNTNSNTVNSCLIINKQDAHLTKYDINGQNDLKVRMDNMLDKMTRIVKRASVVNNLTKGIYILGSDLLDAEWTGMTTKGTPQHGACSYEEGFERVCSHEVEMIKLLLYYVDELEVIYVPGNHDRYVGWHVVNWLKMFFRDQVNLHIDMDPKCTKYCRFDNTALMFNHGDKVKVEKLAQNFPIEFKDEWSLCDHWYIFTGDKHHVLAKDIGGITAYQIPALSNDTSHWEEANLWTMSKARMTAFLITEGVGMSDTYTEMI